MKNLVLPPLAFAAALLAGPARAQTAPVAVRSQKQLEVSVGAATPLFYSGQELLRARDLRAAGQSYYAGPGGTRRAVGEYGRPVGFSVELAYHKPLARTPGLLWGLAVRNGQTGTQPATAGYAEGYFFNFVDFAGSLKYYPLQAANLFVRGQAGLASVFTKNRYVTEAGEQNFHHQFGIGYGGSLATGYTFTPFRNKGLGLEAKAVYQWSSTRVEVNGLGDDQWQWGALHGQVGVVF